MLFPYDGAYNKNILLLYSSPLFHDLVKSDIHGMDKYWHPIVYYVI